MPEYGPCTAPACRKPKQLTRIMRGRDSAPPALDEAIFTEISPLTIPRWALRCPRIRNFS